MESPFTHVHDTPPPGVGADWTIPQNWDAFTADEHAMWDRLFARQSVAHGRCACGQARKNSPHYARDPEPRATARPEQAPLAHHFRELLVCVHSASVASRIFRSFLFFFLEGCYSRIAGTRGGARGPAMPFSDLMGFLPVSTHFLHMRVRG